MLIPETVVVHRDHAFADAPRLRRREGETQEAYEIRRDRTQRRRVLIKARTGRGKLAKALSSSRRKPKIARAQLVNVLTAGDELVCPVCETLARSGPYRLSEARGVLPAHESCRCLWVPEE
jgi:hypothetical protein